MKRLSRAMKLLEEMREILSGGDAEDYVAVLIVLPFILFLLILFAGVMQ